ncbi:hypothetical protein SprV_0501753900 [Sparganum proliferum]
MGSPISGLIAELVLQLIEHLVFTKYQPKFWARYVDDTFAIVKSSDVEHLKELLNSVDPNIQFTMEAETNNQLPFLDVLVRRVEADEVMVSFDVVSLITSIPPDLAIDTLDELLREKYDKTDQQLKRVHIIELLELCLKTFFTFKGQVYEQKMESQWVHLCLD